MKKNQTDAIVVASKQYFKTITKPMTKTFVGEYYIANLNAKEEYLEYLSKHGMKEHFNIPMYISTPTHLITSYPIKNIRNQQIGSYYTL